MTMHDDDFDGIDTDFGDIARLLLPKGRLEQRYCLSHAAAIRVFLTKASSGSTEHVWVLEDDIFASIDVALDRQRFDALICELREEGLVVNIWDETFDSSLRMTAKLRADLLDMAYELRGMHVVASC